MSQYSQVNGIQSARNNLDDQYAGKGIFQFSPLQGKMDGVNLVFQIPQSRIAVYQDATMNLFPQIYKNKVPLVWNVDYVLTSALNGVITFASGKQPTEGDEITCTFNWTWFTDVELDRHLNRAAGECGFVQYYCTAPTVLGSDPLPTGNSAAPSDIPDALFTAITLIAAGLAARALSLRLGTSYDTSAGEQSYSPSQMSTIYEKLALDLEKRGYNARDDFWKGQGRQYRPSTAAQGYVLPSVTPRR